MTGGTINGDNFAPNGPVTINAAAAPAIISANYFYLDNTNSRISSFNVARGSGSADLVINSMSRIGDTPGGSPRTARALWSSMAPPMGRLDDDQRRHAGGQ